MKSFILMLLLVSGALGSDCICECECPCCNPGPEAWPIGTIQFTGATDTAVPAGYDSIPFVVSHPNLLGDCDGWLAIGDPGPAFVNPVGVLALFSGAAGTTYITAENTQTAAMYESLREDGWQIIQVRWRKSWWRSMTSQGEDAGIAHLAARPATVIQAIYDQFAAPVGAPFFCAGQSAGGAQVAYGLSHFGLDGIIDRAIISGGPPFCVLDKSCMDTPGEEIYWLTNKLTQIDKAHGFATDGPAENHDPSFIPRWQEESLAISGVDYSHPATGIRLIFGDMDGTMHAIAGHWKDRLDQALVNDVTWTLAANTAHGIYDTQQGREAILSAIVAP